MTVRPASPDDVDAILEWAVSQPLSIADRWLVDAGDDPAATRRTLSRWMLTTTIGMGVVLVDERHAAIGGRQVPPPRRVRDQLYRRRFSSPGTRTLGARVYPASLSTACHRRLHDLADLYALVSPSTPHQRVTVGAGSLASEAHRGAWLRQAGPLPTVVLAAGDEGEGLRAWAFAPVATSGPTARVPFAVTCWLRPADDDQDGRARSSGGGGP